MSDNRLLDLGSSFVLSAGTVTIDPEKKLMLLILHRAKNELLLPKGRKDKGESLEEAAIRETYEETGYPSKLVLHSLATKATSSATVSEPLHMEPIAVQQRITDDVRKIVFWYVATSDSTSEWTPDTQVGEEDFETRWMPVDEAIKSLAYDDDRKIATQAWGAFSSR